MADLSVISGGRHLLGIRRGKKKGDGTCLSPKKEKGKVALHDDQKKEEAEGGSQCDNVKREGNHWSLLPLTLPGEEANRKKKRKKREISAANERRKELPVWGKERGRKVSH